MSAVVAVEDTRESIVAEAASATCATAVEHAWGFKPTHIEDSVDLALETVNHELRPAAQFRRITIGIDDVLVQVSSCGHACPRMAPSTRYGKGSAQADASASWIEQEIWLVDWGLLLGGRENWPTSHGIDVEIVERWAIIQADIDAVGALWLHEYVVARVQQ
jgi:hypothetical protein